MLGLISKGRKAVNGAMMRNTTPYNTTRTRPTAVNRHANDNSEKNDVNMLKVYVNRETVALKDGGQRSRPS